MGWLETGSESKESTKRYRYVYWAARLLGVFSCVYFYTLLHDPASRLIFLPTAKARLATHGKCSRKCLPTNGCAAQYVHDMLHSLTRYCLKFEEKENNFWWCPVFLI